MANRFRLTTEELCQSRPYSTRSLRRFRKEEILQAGVHYILKGMGAKKPSLLWDPDAVEDALASRSRRAVKR